MLSGLATLSSCSEKNEQNSLDPVEASEQQEIKNDIKSQMLAIYSKSPETKNGVLLFNGSDKKAMAASSLNLLKSHGLTEAEIAADLGGITDDKLIESALAIINVEEKAIVQVELIDYETNISFLTGETAVLHFGTKTQAYDCAMGALGITALGEVLKNGLNKMPRKAVRKLLIKVASKYLGVVGGAIAVYEFGDCMDWW